MMKMIVNAKKLSLIFAYSKVHIFFNFHHMPNIKLLIDAECSDVLFDVLYINIGTTEEKY